MSYDFDVQEHEPTAEERAAKEARELQDRVESMDEQGYSHKPLARRDMADEEVLDALEDWGVFEFACAREDVEDTEIACWMTDPEDLERDAWSTYGTSCVIVAPVVGGYAAHRHSHDGIWEPPFTNVWDTFEEACEAIETASAVESNYRNALAEYRTALAAD